MKRIWIPFIILLVLNGVVTQTLAVDMIGSKAFGMGGAFTAVADDASSLYWNPAGLAYSKFIGGEVSVGIDTGNIYEFYNLIKGLVLGNKNPEPIQGKVTAFIGANLSSYSGALIREEINYSDGVYNYADSLIVGNIALARQIKFLGKTSVGINLKMIQRTYSTYTESGQEVSKLMGQGFAVDCGVLWPVTSFFNLGLSVKNLGPSLVLSDGTDVSPIQKAAVGAALKIAPVGLTLATDVEHNVRTNEDILRVGMEELLLFRLIALRGGIETSLTEQTDMTITGGVGLHLAALGLDLGVASKDYFTNDWNGLISLSLKF